jgi:flagellum-specific ATP synthase
MQLTQALSSLITAVPAPSVLHPRRGGRVTAFDGMTVQASGIELPVGSVCGVGPHEVPAELIGFRDGRALFMGLAALGAVVPGASVLPLGSEPRAQVGAALFGRIIDGSGRPLDNGPRIATSAFWPLEAAVGNPLRRSSVTRPIDVGVRAINGLLTLGVGQRVGIMAGSGVGKSVLLGMMVRNVTADVVVVALIGERGREISDFVASQLDDVARARTIIVAVAADEAPLLRVRGVMRATAIAEYFRSLGRSVVLIVDSLTRVAHAQREIALALGETQGSRGYPASALALLPRLIERAGNDGASGGAITAIYTVLADGDDMNDPVVDTARGVLDGHIVLSRGVAQRGLYPAIDISASVSRVMADIVTPEHGRAAARFRRAHALVEENRDLVLMGAYSHGADPELDVALALRATMEAYRTQPRDQVCGMDEAVDSLGRAGFADEPDDAVVAAGAA